MIITDNTLKALDWLSFLYTVKFQEEGNIVKMSGTHKGETYELSADTEKYTKEKALQMLFRGALDTQFAINTNTLEQYQDSKATPAS